MRKVRQYGRLFGYLQATGAVRVPTAFPVRASKGSTRGYRYKFERSFSSFLLVFFLIKIVPALDCATLYRVSHLV